jgi:transposase
MMGRASVSLKQETQVKTLLNDDQNHRVVAKKVEVTIGYVTNVANMMKTGQPLENTLGQGRKLLSIKQDDQLLLQICKKDRTKSGRQFSSELVVSSGKSLSARTIR